MVGSICNCILPEALKISAVQHDPNCQPYDSEKRSLRSTFRCLSSISMRQKQLSTSSLLLQSPLKGCLPPWELRRSSNGSLKERWKKCRKGRFVFCIHGCVLWWRPTSTSLMRKKLCKVFVSESALGIGRLSSFKLFFFLPGFWSEASLIV